MKKNPDSGVLAIALLMLAAALVFWIPILAKPVATAAKNGSPEQWLGFAGSLLGATIALTAAFIAVRPVKQQLAELARQNDQTAYDQQRARSLGLNADLVLVYKVTSRLEIVSRQLTPLVTQQHELSGQAERLDSSIDLLAEAVEELQKNAGSVWGTQETQRTRSEFLSEAMIAVNTIRNAAGLSGKTNPFKIINLKNSSAKWEAVSKSAFHLGVSLHAMIQREITRSGRRVEELENRIF
jgi:hypothetical protein